MSRSDHPCNGNNQPASSTDTAGCEPGFAQSVMESAGIAAGSSGTGSRRITGFSPGALAGGDNMDDVDMAHVNALQQDLKP